MFGGLKSNCCRGKTRQKTEEERGKRRRRRRRQAFHSSSSPSSLPPPSVVEKQQPLLAPLIWTMEGLASVINFNWTSVSTREMTPMILFCRVAPISGPLVVLHASPPPPPPSPPNGITNNKCLLLPPPISFGVRSKPVTRLIWEKGGVEGDSMPWPDDAHSSSETEKRQQTGEEGGKRPSYTHAIKKKPLLIIVRRLRRKKPPYVALSSAAAGFFLIQTIGIASYGSERRTDERRRDSPTLGMDSHAHSFKKGIVAVRFPQYLASHFDYHS